LADAASFFPFETGADGLGADFFLVDLDMKVLN